MLIFLFLGIPVTGNSSLTPEAVYLYGDTWTWNEAFQSCQGYGQELLNLNSDGATFTLEQVLQKYRNLNILRYK